MHNCLGYSACHVSTKSTSRRTPQVRTMKKPQQKLTHFLAETKKTHPLIQVYRLIIRLNLQHQKSETQKTRQKAEILDRKNVMILVLSLQHQPPTFRYSINKSTLDWNCDPSTRFSNSQTLSMSTVFCFSSETDNEIKKDWD